MKAINYILLSVEKNRLNWIAISSKSHIKAQKKP